MFTDKQTSFTEVGNVKWQGGPSTAKFLKEHKTQLFQQLSIIIVSGKMAETFKNSQFRCMSFCSLHYEGAEKADKKAFRTANELSHVEKS